MAAALVRACGRRGLTGVGSIIQRDPVNHLTDGAAPEPLLQAFSAAQQSGAQVVGLCLGAYVLAQAGLLDGRRATTHWAYAQNFAQRYPLVRVDANVLYVEDQNVLTSAAQPPALIAACTCCANAWVRRRPTASPDAWWWHRTGKADRPSSSSSRCPAAPEARGCRS